MIPLPMPVPAYETRLGPFLHQEETKNISQEHKLCVFTISLLSSVFQWSGVSFVVWPSLVNSSFDLHFVSRWYLSLGVGQWHGGWVSSRRGEPSALCRPPWPALWWHLLKERALLSWRFMYQDVQATTQPAAKRNTFIFDKGERKYILKKVFLWSFCLDFFYSACNYFLHTSSIVIFEI